MTRTSTVALLVLVGSLSSPLVTTRVLAQPSPYQASLYTSKPARVTIALSSGHVLSTLDVPADVALSVHLVTGESELPDPLSGITTFRGQVSIRMMPSDRLAGGGLREQMRRSPFKLDLDDAVVTVTVPPAAK